MKQKRNIKSSIINDLIKNNEYTLNLNDHTFNNYLTLLNNLQIKTDNWLNNSDDVTDEFLNDLKNNNILTQDIFMTKPYQHKKGWFLEFDNYINDNHISTFIICPFKKLNEFLFVALYSNMITYI